jgi:hypothetical protein
MAVAHWNRVLRGVFRSIPAALNRLPKRDSQNRPIMLRSSCFDNPFHAAILRSERVMKTARECPTGNRAGPNCKSNLLPSGRRWFDSQFRNHTHRFVSRKWRPAAADRARNAAAGLFDDCPRCRPRRSAQTKADFLPRRFGRDESLGVAGPHNKTGHAPPALTSGEGSDGPTARARAEGKPGQRTPLCGHGIMWRGAAGPRYRASWLYGAEKCSLHAASLPRPKRGGGERGRRTIAQIQRGNAK